MRDNEYDDVSQVERSGDTINVDFWYPKIAGNVKHVRVGLVCVRAADDIRIHFDYDRNGYVIEMPTIHEWSLEDEVRDEGWREMAFVPAWAEDAPPPPAASTPISSAMKRIEGSADPLAILVVRIAEAAIKGDTEAIMETYDRLRLHVAALREMAKTSGAAAAVKDSVEDLLHYDRKDDKDLPHGEIERLVAAGVVTVDEIVALFRRELEEAL